VAGVAGSGERSGSGGRGAAVILKITLRQCHVWLLLSLGNRLYDNERV
jgi:hypothetical protein